MNELKKHTPPGVRPIQRDRLSVHQFSPDPARYERMPFRHCGASGLQLPVISLGAGQTFGGYVGAEATRECLFRAFNLGIVHFDLANHFGNPAGRAESVVGRVLRELPREEIIVSTKAGARMWPGPMGHGGSRKHLLHALDQSLQRLGLDYVDVFYAHLSGEGTPIAETLATLEEIGRAGKARYLGVSGALMEGTFPTHVVVRQYPCNLLNDRALSECSGKGCGLVACSPLAEGLLSSRARKAWSDAQRDAVSSGMKDCVGKLGEVARERGQTLPQMAIAWLLRQPIITSVVMGASSIDQIEENAKAIEKLEFSESELRRIAEIIRDRS